ncbi:TrbC/VirB2 family protein [Mitsuokella multacida]
MFMKEKMKKNVQGAVRFMKENRLFLFRLSVMGVVALSSDPALAAQSDSTFSVVTSPLEKFSNTITGPVATLIGTAGAGLLGLSVTMNFENQIAKRGVQGVGGIGLGLGAAKVVQNLGGGFLF